MLILCENLFYTKTLVVYCAIYRSNPIKSRHYKLNALIMHFNPCILTQHLTRQLTQGQTTWYFFNYF